MKKYLSLFLILFTFFLFTQHLYAQEPFCDPIDNTDADGNICPIDGGLGFLIAAGVGYGLHRVKKSRNKDEPDVTPEN